EIVIQCSVYDVKVLVIVTDQRRRSDAIIGEIVHGPIQASIQSECAGFGVYAIEAAEGYLAACRDSSFVAETESRWLAPGQTAVSTDDAHWKEATLHCRVVAVVRIVES